MTNSGVSFTDDLDRANKDAKLHLWSGVVTSSVSMFIPILGLVAAYSGRQLTQVMERTWFGTVLAVFGLFNFAFWVYALLFLM